MYGRVAWNKALGNGWRARCSEEVLGTLRFFLVHPDGHDAGEIYADLGNRIAVATAEQLPALRDEAMESAALLVKAESAALAAAVT